MVIMTKGNGGSLLPHLATVLVAALVYLLLAPQQAHSQGLGENSATGNSFEQLLLKHGVAKDSTIIVNRIAHNGAGELAIATMGTDAAMRELAWAGKAVVQRPIVTTMSREWLLSA